MHALEIAEPGLPAEVRDAFARADRRQASSRRAAAEPSDEAREGGEERPRADRSPLVEARLIELGDGWSYIPMSPAFVRPVVPVVRGGMRLNILTVLAGLVIGGLMAFARLPWALVVSPVLMSVALTFVLPRLVARARPQVQHAAPAGRALGIFLSPAWLVFRHRGASTALSIGSVVDVEIQSVRRGKAVRIGSRNTYLYEANHKATLHVAYVTYDDGGELERFHYDRLALVRLADDVDLEADAAQFAAFDGVRSLIEDWVAERRGG